MANKNKTEDQFAQVEQALTKTEQYIVDNQKSLLTIVAIIVGLIALFSVYQNFYIEPMEEEAQAEIYMAQIYFEKDSFNLALNGDLQYPGFLDIADEYSLTKTGKLANYYAGLCYLHTSDYENAIEYLEDFTSEDVIHSALARGCIGDAYMELGDIDNAIEAYEEAVGISNNKFPASRYMMKLAMAHELNKNFNDALEIYKNIQIDFKDSREAFGIEKHISRAENK